MRGFSLLELCITMSILAILACEAIPSFLHHNNQMLLQSSVSNLKWGLMKVPAMPVDPSWQVNGWTYSKAMTRPAGVLTVVMPVTAGGSWSCQFSDPSYNLLRC